ncbi:beta-1,3-galactosyltransferase 5 [Salminus brasiliensis]|uniref:beta-1,3-galactosyltransferase 5 n=1 Tax=Salminus brasiliensis TaxID=930266 RepID=UPI003B839203
MTTSSFQRMATLRLPVKSCFVLLVFITVAVLVIYYVSNTHLQLTKDWLSKVSNNIHSYYIKQPVRIVPPPPRHHQTVKQGTLNGTNVARTTTDSNVTEVLRKSTSSVPSIRYHEAYPRNYHFILDEPNICKQEKPFLVLMVPVAPHELEARKAIRSTWGNVSVVRGKTVRVLFSLGRPGIKDAEAQQRQLNLESKKYHDLIQSDFLDTYLNLTIKTMVIMDWLATRCPNATYAMKVDSDMFLNVENLMSMLLASNTPKENYMTGMVMWNRPVIRDPASKWYVPKKLYDKDYYPTYLLGMGYVFSNDLPKKLVEASKEIKPFNIEDAYIGACLDKLHIVPSNPPDASKFKAYFNGKYDRKEFQRVITTILSSPQQLIDFWQDSRRPT